jgi:hypothetical protein
MVVGNLNVMGIAVAKAEAKPPEKLLELPAELRIAAI